MREKGQASLEAILVMAGLLAMIGVFISAFQGIMEKSGIAGEKTIAVAQAKKCAAVIDSVFANSGGKPKTILENCFPKGPHEILAKEFEREKTAFTIAETIELVQHGNETILEVTTPDHYQ